MPTNEGFSGVSNCYVFKSRLQEYAQKVGIPTPVYETTKEGPSHEPAFRSTVIVNDIRYESLPGFFNRKAAEQSAAEIALMELAKSSEVNESISQPVHETGLCKNLLQEYAQKMNYAIPLYQCQKEEAPGRVPRFSCAVDIGGIRYIGAAAKTKKEAEIKAARTALLAIQTIAPEVNFLGNSDLTVVPCRKRVLETTSNPAETKKTPKAKKARFRKKMSQKKQPADKLGQDPAENTDNIDAVEPNGREISVLVMPAIGTSENGHATDASLNQSNHEKVGAGLPSGSAGDKTIWPNEVNMVTGAGEVASAVNSSSFSSSSVMAG